MKTSRLVDAEKNAVYTLGYFGDIYIYVYTWNSGRFISLECFEIFDVCLCMWLYTIFPFFHQQILEQKGRSWGCK